MKANVTSSEFWLRILPGSVWMLSSRIWRHTLLRLPVHAMTRRKTWTPTSAAAVQASTVCVHPCHRLTLEKQIADQILCPRASPRCSLTAHLPLFLLSAARLTFMSRPPRTERPKLGFVGKSYGWYVDEQRRAGTLICRTSRVFGWYRGVTTPVVKLRVQDP